MDDDLEFEAWFGNAVRKVQDGQQAIEEEPQNAQPDGTEEAQED